MGKELKETNAYNKYYDIYDQVVLKMLPFYAEMHKEMVDLIEKDRNEKISVLELGYGTGTLTYQILKEFLNAEVLGVDNHEENMKKAQEKLKDFNNFSYMKSDFRNFRTEKLFNAVISALSVHHLSDKEKQIFFKFILDKLKPGGRFIIGDIVKSSEEEGWHKYLVDSMGEEGEFRWQRHKNNKDDKPSTLENQMLWLKQAGFDKIEAVNNWFNFYVFYGQKQK